jgi:hypothetical protein
MRRLLLFSLFIACGSPEAPVAPTVPPPPPRAAVAPPKSRFAGVTLARSTSSDPLPVGVPAIVVSKNEIALEGEQAIVPLGDDRTHGTAGQYKRSGPTDLFIVPLAEALKRRGGSEAVFAFDASTPYRLAIEVMFTAGQSELTVFHLAVDNGGTLADLRSIPPRVAPAPTAKLGLTVLIVNDGISIKTVGGNVAPGCQDKGPGLAIAKKDGAYDFDALRACTKRLRDVVPEAADDKTFTVTANPPTEMRDVVAAIDSVRPFFPELTYGIAR